MSKNDNGLIITTDDEAEIIKIIESNLSDDKYVDFTDSPLLIKEDTFYKVSFNFKNYSEYIKRIHSDVIEVNRFDYRNYCEKRRLKES